MGIKEPFAHGGNKETRYFRALFRFGQKRELIADSPVRRIGFLPTEKRISNLQVGKGHGL
jgi:hypothetical protein